MIDFAPEPGGPPFTREDLLKANNSCAVNDLAVLIAKRFAEEKEKWMRAVMCRHLPDFVIAWADSKDEKLMVRAARWMAKKQYELQEHKDGRCRLVRGPKVLGEFRMIMKDGKATFEQT